MTVAIRHHLSSVLAPALLASLLAASTGSQAAESNYDNVERIDVSSYAAAGIAVSKRVFPDGADAAVLTRDDHFPDALAASALAAKVNGPVLFTATGSLTSSTATELDRILDAGDTVYITGGDAAVSDNVANQVRARGYEVSRLSGPTRIETAVEIAEVVEAPSSGHVLLARARGPAGQDRTTGWVDSVTCGAYANHAQTPILLSHTASLDTATSAALDTLGATKVTICGGEAAVSANVAQQLSDAGLTVARVSGETRIETAIGTAKKLFGATSADGQTYVLVTGYGENFGWGLAATPLAGALGAPMLLVGADQPTSCTDTSQRARATLCYLETVGSGSADLLVIGSATQVSDAVRDAAAKSAGGQTGTTTGSDALATPTSVKTSNVSTPSEGRVTVSWAAVSDPDDRLEGYNVHYGQSSPDTRAGSSTPTVGPDATSFTVGALQLDTSYTFAVTSVTTDGQESAKSSAVTEKTTAPSVDLSDPTSPGTSPGPATVDSNAMVPITFSYDLSQGGTYQLMYKTASATGWKPFSETGSGQPLAPGSHEKTLDVVAPANNGVEDVDYWLRVAVYPSGGSISDTLDDIEVDALRVLADLDERVQIGSPTATTGRATVFPGDPFDLTFTYSTEEAVSYRVSYRESGTKDAFTPFEDPDATGDVVPRSHDEQITVELDSPAEVARYELFVELLDASGAPTAQGSATDALVVREAEVMLTAPTTLARAVRAEDGSLEVSFDYVSNAEREYEISYRAPEGTEWTPFPNGQGTVPAAPSSTSFGPVDVGELPAGGTYNVRVALRDTGDTADDATDTENGALVVADVDLTDPWADDPLTVDGGQTFPATFTTNADGQYRLLHSDDGGETWTEFATWADVAASPEGVTKQATAPANDTSDEVTYDLRIEFRLGDTGEGDASDEEPGALVVSGQTATDPDVEIVTPTGEIPEEIADGATFTVEFNTPNIASGTYRIVAVDKDGGTEELVAPTPIDGGDTTINEAVPAPARTPQAPAANTFDLRVEVDDGTTVHPDEELDAVRVADVVIDGPTDATPTEGSTMQVEFRYNAAGHYKLYHSTNGSDWTAFTGTQAEGSRSTPGGDEETVQATVDVPSGNEGTLHSVRVVFNLTDTPTTPDDGEATDDHSGAFTPQEASTGGPTIVIDSPDQDDEQSVDEDGTFDITFTASEPGVYTLMYRSDGGSTWTAFDGTGTGPATGSQQTVTVTAPPATGVYDLRAELDTDASDGGHTDADAEDEKLRAIEVVAASGGSSTNSAEVTVTGPACVVSATPTRGFFVDTDPGSSAIEDGRLAVTIARAGLAGNEDDVALRYLPPGGTFTDASLTPENAPFVPLYRWAGFIPNSDTFAIAADATLRFELELSLLWRTNDANSQYTLTFWLEEGGTIVSNVAEKTVTATETACA